MQPSQPDTSSAPNQAPEDAALGLLSPDPEVRMAAAYALGAGEVTGDEASPLLIGALRDPVAEVRVVAAFALGKVHAADPAQDLTASLAALQQALADPAADVRYSAARALGLIGPRASTLIPDLEVAAADASEDVRNAAVRALTAIGVQDSSIPLLVRALDDPNWYIREAAAEALKSSPEAAAPALVFSLAASTPDETPTTWRQNSAIVALLPEIGAPALDLLPEAFDPEVSGQTKALAALALFRMGPAATAILTATTTHDDRQSRHVALGVLGYQADAGLLASLAALAYPDEPTRTHAALALAQIGPAALPALAARLNDPAANPEAQQAAVRAVAAIAEPRDIVRALLLAKATAAGTDPRVVVAALAGLTRPGSEALAATLPGAEAAPVPAGAVAVPAVPALAVPAIQKLAQHGDPQVRTAAAAALGAISPPNGEAILTLEEMLQTDVDPAVRAAAATAFGAGSPGDAAAIDMLAELLRTDADPAVRAAAATAIGASGVWAASAVPTLIGALKADDLQLQGAAAVALARVDPAAATTTPALLELLGKTDQAVAAFGLAGSAALPVLLPHLPPAGSDDFCNQPVAEAILAMGAAAVTPIMLTVLVERNVQTRAGQIEMLGCFGSAATPARTYLAGYLAAADLPVQAAAANALAQISGTHRELTTLAADALHSAALETRCWAAAALVLLGADANSVQPQLLQALLAASDDEVCIINRAILVPGVADAPRELLSALTADTEPPSSVSLSRLLRAALLRNGAPTPDAAGPLMAALHDPILRRRAAEAASELGFAVQAGLLELISPQTPPSPALAEALTGKGNDVRRAALYSLLLNADLRAAGMLAARAVAYDAQADHELRTMAAAVLAADGAATPALWQALGKAPTTTIVCPAWPEMGLSADPRFDLFAGYCAYESSPVAPTIPEVATALCQLLGGCQ
ncbi:MAG: HEAT repeat domain-containing protein [Caldilineaceae bacterium]